MKCDRILLAGCAVALALSVSACTPNDINMGAAAKHNYALQIINPDPVYEDSVPATDGNVSAGAVERYRTDKVKKPVSAKTTTGGSGSGGSPN